MARALSGLTAYIEHMPRCTNTRYMDRDCRCNLCVSAHDRANREDQLNRAGKLKLSDPRHGILAGHNTWRCRCEDCRDAMRAYHRARKAVNR